MLYDFEFDSYRWSVENVRLNILTHSESFAQRKTNDYGKPIHSHMYYEILFCNKNDSAMFYYGNNQVYLSKNDFVICSPYCFHRARVEHPEDLFSWGFLYKERNAKEEPKQDVLKLFNDTLQGNAFIIGKGDEHLGELCEKMQDYSSKDDPLYELSAVSAFLAALFHIFIQLKKGWIAKRVPMENPEEIEPKTHSTRISPEIASKINNLLSDSFMTDVTPEDISRQYYISVKQINRYIFNQYGKTFMQRKAQLRMTMAEGLLKEGTLPIAEISKRVGYESINSFYSAFKQYFGITPHRYRMGEKPTLLEGKPI